VSDVFEIGVALALSDGVSEEMARLRRDMARWQAGLRAGGVPVAALHRAAGRAQSVSGAAAAERVVVPKTVQVPPSVPSAADRGAAPASPTAPDVATHRPEAGVPERRPAQAPGERLVAVVHAAAPQPVAPSGQQARPLQQAPGAPVPDAAPAAASLGTIGERARQPAAVAMAVAMRPGAVLPAAWPADNARTVDADGPAPDTRTGPDRGHAPATLMWVHGAGGNAPPGAPAQPAAPVRAAIIQQAEAGQAAGGATVVQPAGGAERGVQPRPNGDAKPASPDPGLAPQGAQGPNGGDVFLDGVLVGKWMSRFLGREVMRAPSGPTGFDPRRGRLMPGATVGG
jgi:hypothetical protein